MPARPRALAHTDKHKPTLPDNLIMQFYASTINISVTLSISIRFMGVSEWRCVCDQIFMQQNGFAVEMWNLDKFSKIH